MDAFDTLVIEGVKHALHLLPGFSGTSSIMGSIGSTGFLFGTLGAAVLGQIAVCVIQGMDLKNSKHADKIAWIVTGVGVIAMVVILL